MFNPCAPCCQTCDEKCIDGVDTFESIKPEYTQVGGPFELTTVPFSTHGKKLRLVKDASGSYFRTLNLGNDKSTRIVVSFARTVEGVATLPPTGTNETLNVTTEANGNVDGVGFSTTTVNQVGNSATITNVFPGSPSVTGKTTTLILTGGVGDPVPVITIDDTDKSSSPAGFVQHIYITIQIGATRRSITITGSYAIGIDTEIHVTVPLNTQEVAIYAGLFIGGVCSFLLKYTYNFGVLVNSNVLVYRTGVDDFGRGGTQVPIASSEILGSATLSITLENDCFVDGKINVYLGVPAGFASSDNLLTFMGTLDNPLNVGLIGDVGGEWDNLCIIHNQNACRCSSCMDCNLSNSNFPKQWTFSVPDVVPGPPFLSCNNFYLFICTFTLNYEFTSSLGCRWISYNSGWGADVDSRHGCAPIMDREDINLQHPIWVLRKVGNKYQLYIQTGAGINELIRYSTTTWNCYGPNVMTYDPRPDIAGLCTGLVPATLTLTPVPA